MIRPDDEEKPFIARWNAFVRIWLVDPSVKLTAYAAVGYADFYDGTRCRPSNERLARETGYNERTIRTAWAVLRAEGLAERVGDAVAHMRQSDEYELMIPDNWASMAILGPHGRKFTCLECGRKINPQGHCGINENGRVWYSLIESVFCPQPRKKKGRAEPWCFNVWNARRKKAGEPTWAALQEQDSSAPWKLFRLSRGDDW